TPFPYTTLFRSFPVDRHCRRMTKILCRSLLAPFCIAYAYAQAGHVVPPEGKLYHGFYWGGVGTDEHDPTEHDVTPGDVERYEQAVGKQTAWIYFSDNWFESRKFPVT